MRNQPILFGDTYRLNVYNASPRANNEENPYRGVLERFIAKRKLEEQLQAMGLEIGTRRLDNEDYLFTSGPTEDTLSRLNDIIAQVGHPKLAGATENPPRQPTDEEAQQWEKQQLANDEAVKGRLMADGLVNRDTPTLDVPYEADESLPGEDQVSLTTTALNHLARIFG